MLNFITLPSGKRLNANSIEWYEPSAVNPDFTLIKFTNKEPFVISFSVEMIDKIISRTTIREDLNFKSEE